MVTLRLENSDYTALMHLVRKHDSTARLQFVLEDSLVLDTPSDRPLCFSCGVNPGNKTTESGEHICKDCDDYYAFGGPGETEV